MGVGRVCFGWYVVFLGALGHREVDVPRAMPPVTIIALIGASMGDAVGGVMTSRGATVWIGTISGSFPEFWSQDFCLQVKMQRQ
jgi:hypothetical protein